MFKISCIQLKSDGDLHNNLLKTSKLIKKAVSHKTDFILTPEASSIMTLDKKDLLNKVTNMRDDIYIKGICVLAKKYKKWILIGSAFVKNIKKQTVNRSILINPKGKIVKYYDKIHMYDAVLSKKEKYFESKVFKAGKNIQIYQLPWGKIGFSICYDLRFPRMFRTMSKKGCDFLCVPSAFTQTTGKRHWHSLLKARAIENFCYIFAPAQEGTHWNGRKTYGHSLIISPDGKILKELKKGTGVITTIIDANIPKILRKIIPSLDKD
jgi:predicted amidohydrolase